jgi:predicted RNA binding protein YcfA (HicA-like mRNA interferase family)
MPSLKSVPGKKVIAALERLGFTQIAQQGSHVKMRKETEGGKFTCTVPLHDSLKTGTLQSIIRQAGITKDELLENL